MTRLIIKRPVIVDATMEVNLVALFNAFDEFDVATYFGLFRDSAPDAAPGWWLREHGLDYGDDVPVWQRPMVYLAQMEVHPTILNATQAERRHVQVGDSYRAQADAEPPYVNRRDDDPVERSKWTEDDYRALCLAVPWLGESADSAVSREELDRVPGPNDVPLV